MDQDRSAQQAGYVPQQQPAYFQPPPPQQPGYYPLHQPYGYGYPQPQNGIGIAAMVVGIVGLALIWIPFVGLVLAVIAIPLAVVGMRRTMGPAPTATNKGMAITGLVTGLVGLGLGLFWTIVVFAAAEDTDDYLDCVDRADSISEMDACDGTL